MGSWSQIDKDPTGTKRIKEKPQSYFAEIPEMQNQLLMMSYMKEQDLMFIMKLAFYIKKV